MNALLFLSFPRCTAFLHRVQCDVHSLWTPLPVHISPAVSWWQVLKLITEGECFSLERSWSWKQTTKPVATFCGHMWILGKFLADSRLDFTDSPQRTEVALEFVQSSISAIWSQPSDGDYEHTPNGSFLFMGLCLRAVWFFIHRTKQPCFHHFLSESRNMEHFLLLYFIVQMILNIWTMTIKYLTTLNQYIILYSIDKEGYVFIKKDVFFLSDMLRNAFLYKKYQIDFFL